MKAISTIALAMRASSGRALGSLGMRSAGLVLAGQPPAGAVAGNERGYGLILADWQSRLERRGGLQGWADVLLELWPERQLEDF